MDSDNKKLLDLKTKSVELLNNETGSETVEGQGSGDPYAYCKIGDYYQSLRDYNSAKGWYERNLKIAKNTGDKVVERIACCKLGLVNDYIGSFEEAICCHERDLQISKEFGDKTGEERAHCNLGHALLRLGNYKEAIDHSEHGLKIAKEIDDKTAEKRACCNLGNAYQYLGDLKRAIYYYEWSLKLCEELGDRDGHGGTLGNLGCAFEQLGDFRKAMDYHERHLSISKKSGNRKEEGDAYRNIGDTHYSLGDFKTAVDFHERAVRIAQEVGDRPGEGTAYVNLGSSYIKLGSFKEAIHYLKLGIQIFKELGRKVQERKAYGNLGACYNKLGDFKTAIEYHELSLQFAKKVGDRKGEGNSYAELGNTYRSLGDFEKAVVYYNRKLEIAKELRDKVGEGVAYATLGIAYQELGDLKQSIDYLERSLKIRRETGDRSGEGSCYGNLGNAYCKVGDFTKAIEYYKLHLKFTQKLGERDQESACYSNLGNAYRYLEKFDEAKKYYQLSLQIVEEVGDGPRDAEAKTHFNLGCIFEKEGSLSEAVKCYKSSVAILNDIRDRLQNKDEWKISLRDMFQTVYNSLWHVLLKQDKIKEALYFADQGRAQALKDLLESKYGFQRTFLPSSSSEEASEKMLSYVPQNTVFIAIHGIVIFYWVIQKGKDVQLARQGISSHFSSVLQSILEIVRDITSVRVGDKCEDRSLDKLREEVQSCKRSGLEGFYPSRTPDGVFKDLYQVIIEPIADLIKDEEELTIIPEGQLCLVPYAALTGSNSKCLAESFRIRVLPSLNSLKLITDCREDYHCASGVLLVGNPWVQEFTVQGRKLEQLPYAQAEVEMIGRILNTAPLIKRNATKDEVLKRLSSVALVHIAAHGSMETGAIALSPNLTRASHVPTEEDFLLTMKDVLKVKLRARLVVLSCCHSARGKPVNAEGVVGIARAFLGAGARSVLVSLWAIDDKATMKFMESFYQHLAEGRSASEALNRAMNLMRESGEFSDVRYWAPFVLIGDDVKLEFGPQVHD